ncbi:MAG: hypothetical protein ACXAC8_18710 [Candidatus Hodarchaeales archaeon]
MDKKDYYKYMFLTGAAWNIVLGIVSILAPILTKESLSTFGVETPTSLMFYHLFYGVALVVGIGYYLVSTNLDQNHGIVLIGVIGKLWVFFTIGFYFFMGDVNLLGVMLSVGDLIYAILFIEFLLNYRKL